MRLDLPRDQKCELVSMSYLISSDLLRQMLEILRWNSTYKDTFLDTTLGAYVRIEFGHVSEMLIL